VLFNELNWWCGGGVFVGFYTCTTSPRRHIIGGNYPLIHNSRSNPRQNAMTVNVDGGSRSFNKTL
jgi:hypothetical protein